MAYQWYPLYNLLKPVGPKCQNIASDVALVRSLLQIVAESRPDIKSLAGQKHGIYLQPMTQGATYIPDLGDWIVAFYKLYCASNRESGYPDLDKSHIYLAPISIKNGMLAVSSSDHQGRAFSALCAAAMSANFGRFCEIGAKLRLSVHQPNSKFGIPDGY